MQSYELTGTGLLESPARSSSRLLRSTSTSALTSNHSPRVSETSEGLGITSVSTRSPVSGLCTGRIVPASLQMLTLQSQIAAVPAVSQAICPAQPAVAMHVTPRPLTAGPPHTPHAFCIGATHC